MTVNRNPKKSRPYDQPPKKRRSLIPGAPDSAAGGFFAAAAIWMVVAASIGLLAIGFRVIPVEFAFPIGFLDLGFELNERRADYAFANATVYGWLTNAFFGALLFMTPRLLGRRVAAERLVNVGLLIWNLSLAGGIAALYVFDLGPNAALTAMPWLIEGGLATGALVVTAAFVATAGSAIRGAYVATWFGGVALLALTGLMGLSATIGLVELFVDLPDVAVALTSFFVERAVMTMWLLGATFAALHYLVPRATGLPLASGGLAILTWLTWLALTPLSALADVRDTQVPYVISTFGSVATILLLVPASLAVVNLAQSMQGRWTGLFGSGPLAFVGVAATFLLAVALLDAIGALTTVRAAVANTEWERGLFLWATYGAFGMAALAAAEHAMPRILRRSWAAGPLSAGTMWLTFGGATIAGTALIGGGLAEASFVAAVAEPAAIDAGLLPYRVAAFLGFGLAALAGLAHLANLFLLYTSGEPADYVVPGATATAAAGH